MNSHQLKRLFPYLASFVFGFAVATIVAFFAGSLSAFYWGMFGTAMAILFLLTDSDLIPLVAIVGYFVGLAIISGWIPVPTEIPL